MDLISHSLAFLATKIALPSYSGGWTKPPGGWTKPPGGWTRPTGWTRPQPTGGPDPTASPTDGPNQSTPTEGPNSPTETPDTTDAPTIVRAHLAIENEDNHSQKKSLSGGHHSL